MSEKFCDCGNDGAVMCDSCMREITQKPKPASEFACCGGTDEHPKEHCQDCPDQAPQKQGQYIPEIPSYPFVALADFDKLAAKLAEAEKKINHLVSQKIALIICTEEAEKERDRYKTACFKTRERLLQTMSHKLVWSCYPELIEAAPYDEALSTND